MATGQRRTLTIGDVLDGIAPRKRWTNLAEWPPDAFAAAGAILAESGAYRLVVSPAASCHWPPASPPGDPRGWADAVREDGQEWAAWAVWISPTSGGRRPPRPRALRRILKAVEGARGLALSELTKPHGWNLACELLTLFAMADEACAGVIGAAPTARPVRPFHAIARIRLARNGSLARLPRDRVRVLPKLRVPQSGITIRSLSRHVSFDHSEVAPHWLDSFSVEAEERQNRFTLLLVPWPPNAFPTEFSRVSGPLLNMSPDKFGFFQYSPVTPFEPAMVVELVSEAVKRVGQIDMVVLPESVLQPEEAQRLRQRLLAANIPYLLAGIREPADQRRALGANYAYLSGVRSDGTQWDIRQYKHHRWFLDRSQIEQYHLGPALDPNRRWWEAIDVTARRLTFVGIRDWLTLCPLICEDLARPDPVANLLRAVGPSLVIALLLDGPQLASRWPARYATVLADDPGCAVLTLSSLGLVNRSKPPGVERSRVVALWKDLRGFPRQIELERESEAIALTLSATSSKGVTADGREEDGATADVVLSGIEQISR